MDTGYTCDRRRPTVGIGQQVQNPPPNCQYLTGKATNRHLSVQTSVENSLGIIGESADGEKGALTIPALK